MALCFPAVRKVSLATQDKACQSICKLSSDYCRCSHHALSIRMMMIITITIVAATTLQLHMRNCRQLFSARLSLHPRPTESSVSCG